MKRLVLASLLAFAMLTTSCAAKGADEADRANTTAADNGGGSDTTTDDGGDGDGDGDTVMFGDMASPCGPGTATVKADEAGAGTDKLYIGVGNDRDSIRPGLLKELWDGTNAFVSWCNEQGGVAGLQLEAVDLDGKVLEVEAAMAKACTGVFAIVGGGWAQDNFIFSGKDGADFHKCGMIAVPGFAVSTDFSEASDQVQPLPNPAKLRPSSHLIGMAEMYPDEVKKFGVVYGNLPSIIQNKDQTIGAAKQIDGYGGFEEISYDIISQDWAVVAQQVLSRDLQSVSFLGEPPNFSKFSQALRDQGYEGIISSETNQYDSRLIEASGPDAVEGVIVRTAFHPLEEADDWPAVADFVEIMDTHVPDWQRAALALQAFSASLLFAQVAAECGADGGEISRECVLTGAQDVHEWDAGGLHAAGDPGANVPPDCAMLVQIQGGVWTRLYPEVGSGDDDGDGFACADLVELEGDYGQGNKDSSILDG